MRSAVLFVSAPDSDDRFGADALPLPEVPVAHEQPCLFEAGFAIALLAEVVDVLSLSGGIPEGEGILHGLIVEPIRRGQQCGIPYVVGYRSRITGWC